MAASKLAILSVFLAIILSQIRADASVPAEEDEPVKLPRSDGPDSSALKIELDQLRAKIHSPGSFLSSSANSSSNRKPFIFCFIILLGFLVLF